MSSKSSVNYSDLWSRLKNELNHYDQEIGIEYLDYRRREFFHFEVENQNYEQEFTHFPYEEIEASQSIEVFHEFYETEIWGLLGPIKIGDENLVSSQIQIASNSEKDRSKYIYNKLLEKFSNIEDDIQRAFIGPKKHLQLPENNPEEPILIILQNLYSRILSSQESQLKIFENINLNKTVSNTYTELLLTLIQDRIKILSPRLKKYRQQVKGKFKVEEVEMSKATTLIKLNYDPEQQTKIIRLLFDNLVPELLEVSYLQFERHFITKRSKISKMVWKGKEVEIAHLFLSLRNKNIIIIEHQNKLIEHHFYNNQGESFKHKQISASLSRTQIETYPIILNIIKKLEMLVLTFN